MQYLPARPWIFWIGLLITVTSVITGYAIFPRMSALGIQGFTAQYGIAGIAGFVGFAFGVPLGLAISALGTLDPVRDSRGYRLLSAVFLICVALLAVLVPLVAGRQPDAAYFGAGGWILLGLVLATIWLWGARRAGMPQGERQVADLQGAGYLCFALAAWNLCGVAAMPSYALEPEKMLALGSHDFAVGQVKTVMAQLLLGWVFTVWGYRKDLQRRSLPADDVSNTVPGRR